MPKVKSIALAHSRPSISHRRFQLLEGAPSRLNPPPTRRARRRSILAKASAESLPSLPYTLDEGVEQGWWVWKGSGDRPATRIRYQKAETRSDEDAPVVLLVHGFGGNCDHFRKNIGVLSESARAYSIDLLGYGYSDKPSPNEHAGGAPNALYNYHTWANQLNAFLDEVVRPGSRKVMLVCNSVGSIAGLQAIYDRDGKGYGGIMLMNPALREQHEKKLAWYTRPFFTLVARLLRETPLGTLFFKLLSTPFIVSFVLKMAYHDDSKVTDELVQCLLEPARTPGAAKVFLDFISYTSGPLAEELIPEMPFPVKILWGDEDRKLKQAHTRMRPQTFSLPILVRWHIGVVV